MMYNYMSFEVRTIQRLFVCKIIIARKEAQVDILDLRDELNICFPAYLIEYLLYFV